MPAPQKVSDSEIIEAIRLTKGRITHAADLLGIASATIHERRKDNEALQLAILEAREALIDMAEAGLDRLLAEGDFRAINLTLRTLGKNRGYVERLDRDYITDEELDRAIARERRRLEE